MRLKPEEVKTIKEAIFSLDPDARVFLFGSRADPSKKGGDIDLLVLSQELDSMDSLKIQKKLFKRLQEQKIDVIVASDDSDPFIKIALNNGIEL